MDDPTLFDGMETEARAAARRWSRTDTVDAALGDALRDEAIDRVEQHAAPEFLDVAYTAVRRLAATRATFTTDDVWRLIEEADPAPATHEPRAMGAVMRFAKRDGYVVPLDEWTLSTRPECHRRPVRVWASRIYDGN